MPTNSTADGDRVHGGNVPAEAPDTGAVRRIERELERLIGAGELAPGVHVNESAVATRLRVGRAAVREACRLLERGGLLTIVPHQGAFVRTPSFDEILQLFDIRASLARLAGHEAAANVEASALAALDALVQQMDAAAGARDADAYVTLNLRFHDLLYRASGNARLAELDRQLGAELRAYRRHGLAHGGGLRVSNAEHRQLLDAVARGDRAAAAACLEEHIRAGRERFVRAMSATGRLALQDAGAAPRRRHARGAR